MHVVQCPDLIQNLSEISDPSIDPSTVGQALAEMVSMEGWLSRRKGNREKRLRYARWHKNCAETSGNRSDGGMNPPQSSDLNIIEAVWDHPDRERNTRQPTSKEELWDVLQEAWRTIPEDYLKKWQNNLSERVQAVLKNKIADTKCWLSITFKLYKLCFCPKCCISIHFCTFQ